MKMLVIEDEEDIREIVCEFLSILKIDHSVAADGKEAIDVFTQEKFDIVFTDLKLPNINGIEIIKKIRETDNNIFIVACSGFNDEETKSKAFLVGADYYIEKPFTFDEISKVLEMAKEKNKITN